jgi:autotransporter family porin
MTNPKKDRAGRKTNPGTKQTPFNPPGKPKDPTTRPLPPPPGPPLDPTGAPIYPVPLVPVPTPEPTPEPPVVVPQP